MFPMDWIVPIGGERMEKKKMIDIKSYQEGFMDGIGYKDDYKICLLGHDLTELLKIVDDYSTKEPKMPTKAKMTRAEAIKLMEKHLPFSNNVEKVIDFYIEAGMLEIVEEENTGLPMNFKFPFNERNEWEKCCNALRQQGFKIVKKDT